MKIYEATEQAYKNGYAKGYKDGRDGVILYGEWIEVDYTYFGAKRYMCSRCTSDDYWHKRYVNAKEKYCPNCGAKMKNL